MKVKLITNLKSRVLLVDGIESEAKHIRLIKFNEHFQINYDLPKQDNYNVGGGFRLNFDDFGGRKHYPANLTYIGRLKDLTDSDCEGLVSEIFGMFENYSSSGKKGTYRNQYFSAKESFLSAIEAEGVLFSNDLKKPEHYDLWAKYGSFSHKGESIVKECKEYFEADQNVFSPDTLIFVEL